MIEILFSDSACGSLKAARHYGDKYMGDAWVALRIEEMMQAGKLKAASAIAEDMPSYHRMLKKCP